MTHLKVIPLFQYRLYPYPKIKTGASLTFETVIRILWCEHSTTTTKKQTNKQTLFQNNIKENEEHK